MRSERADAIDELIAVAVSLSISAFCAVRDGHVSDAEMASKLDEQSRAVSAALKRFRDEPPADIPAVIFKSETHESAFWNAFSENGGYPYALGHECCEPSTWAAYLDLVTAGLLDREPALDKSRNGKPWRSKFSPRWEAYAIFERLVAYRKRGTEWAF